MIKLMPAPWSVDQLFCPYVLLGSGVTLLKNSDGSVTALDEVTAQQLEQLGWRRLPAERPRGDRAAKRRRDDHDRLHKLLLAAGGMDDALTKVQADIAAIRAELGRPPPTEKERREIERLNLERLADAAHAAATYKQTTRG